MKKSDKTAALILILLMIVALFGCFYAFTRVIAHRQRENIQADTTHVQALYEDIWGNAVKEGSL
ncbi:MAG: hypothetical protein IK041_01225 [Bacteroidales bacterium]|nr:hypothetical protein [Bacteroidales bacterium]